MDKSNEIAMPNESNQIIPANEKVFQLFWRSRAYTGDKFGKS